MTHDASIGSPNIIYPLGLKWEVPESSARQLIRVGMACILVVRHSYSVEGVPELRSRHLRRRDPVPLLFATARALLQSTFSVSCFRGSCTYFTPS